MRLHIASIGKLKDDGERQLVHRYQKRIDGIGPQLGFSQLVIDEFSESRQGTAALRKRDEAALLLKACEKSERIIALDAAGKLLTSPEFSQRLSTIRDDGPSSLSFVIGGADGLDRSLIEAAAWPLSLGRLTLPHGLARVVLVEQVYRALTIAAGHPYHRD
jgi:23S rRNA (pseudouridine1915-N3)-methyltransferase